MIIGRMSDHRVLHQQSSFFIPAATTIANSYRYRIDSTKNVTIIAESHLGHGRSMRLRSSTSTEQMQALVPW